ncbi:MAG: hypothetical protein FVQ83_03610 [Chloroflexi bacterium]|nr:hypothetical protein [Chloroflexota bacterium]
MIEIYHQLGWRFQWNFQSHKDDGVGDGFILGPRYMAMENVVDLDLEIKQKSVFDPQFFIPGFPKGKLKSYGFFPEIFSDGFSTDDFSGDIANEAARNCVRFQLEQDFKYIIIPSRYYPGNPEKYIEMQEKLFINPFLQELSETNSSKEVFLQLLLDEGVVKDEEYSAKILNWVTSIPKIDGIYLITEFKRRSKQIKDIDFLLALLHFIHALTDINNKALIIGYVNIELLLLSLANPTVVTLGSYENLRMFDIRKFEESSDQAIYSQPTPRIYMSSLLQMMDSRYIEVIKESQSKKNLLFDENHYQAEMFEPEFNWNFNKAQLYKHYFLSMTNQVRELSALTGIARYNYFVDMVNNAISNYEYLEEKGIIFDTNSDSTHLTAWLTAANKFAIYQGWR